MTRGRGRPGPQVIVRPPKTTALTPERRVRIVNALAEILVAHMEREASDQARLSPSRDKVSSDRNEEAKAS